MGMLSDIIMIFSGSLFMVCLSIAFRALNYNFSSGSGDALAYDSLKQVKMESRFKRYESNQFIIYRLCSGISTLCAGFALTIGYRIAYGTSLITSTIQIIILLSLHEICIESSAKDSGVCWIMTLGGFIAAIGDDALQVRTNAILQDMFPSEQRATLTSIESFSFSVIMIVLSPLAGFVFTYW